MLLKYKLKYKFSFISLILLTLLNFSNQPSIDPNNTNNTKIDFIGTIKTDQEKAYKVKNISICGQYKDIAIYPKPNNKYIDPETNATKLNLKDIKSITRLNNYKDSVYKYKSRKYIEIKVNWKNNNNNNQDQIYLIENYKKIFCNKKNSNQSKEIAFQALEKLDITS